MIFKRRKRARERAAADERAEGEARAASKASPDDGGTPSATEPAASQRGAEASSGSDHGGDEPAPDSIEEDAGQRTGLIADTREAMGSVRKRHLLVASLGLMGFSIIGVFVFSVASFWWTSQPSFCNRCHVMEPYVAEWERSSHRDVNCESCHLTPGFFGYIGGKISGLQVVANYIRGDYEDWSFNAAVANNACLRCHENILAGNIHDTDTGITVSHENIIGMGAKCVQCHSTVAHGSAVAVGSQTHPTMATCLTCHNDKIAPLQCDLCHTGRKPPSGTPPPATAPPGTG